jgi:hypothetical protein
MTVTARNILPQEFYDEGYRSLIAFEDDPDLEFWEMVVGAPGIDGGDPVPTTTMHNNALRTKAPRKLKELMPFQVQGKFNSGTVDAVYAQINVVQWITIHWPDSATYSFPGFIKSFQPGQAQEGNPLEGTLEVVPTGQIDSTETEHSVVAGTGTG